MVTIEKSYEEANFAAHRIWGDLYSAGFIVAEEKTILVPTQVFEWLAISWNTIEGFISINVKRINKAKKLV